MRSAALQVSTEEEYELYSSGCSGISTRRNKLLKVVIECQQNIIGMDNLCKAAVVRLCQVNAGRKILGVWRIFRQYVSKLAHWAVLSAYNFNR